MKLSDLLKMSMSSLWRRKLRTFLTVLGVIIGTASIVVMMSLGIGLNRQTMEQIESSGGLTAIEVYGGGSGYYVSDGIYADSGASSDEEPRQLTDEVMEQIGQLPHVILSSGILSMSILVRQGAYESYLYLQGMKAEALEAMKIPLAEGRLPTEGGSELELLLGNLVICDFYNSATGSAPYYENGEVPDVDLMGQPLFAILDMDAYYSSMEGGEGKPPKKYLVNVSGIVEGSLEDYNEYSWNVYADLDTMENVLNRVFKGKAIPGQPTQKNGKPYKYLIYDQGFVKVDDMAHVADVQKMIGELGFQTYSSSEYVESMQQQYNQIQAVLGGIGAVSLFVAAIGITNTMMMSIYERTKEIGIMKVLGCSLSNIRALFLLEAAFIGLLGGILGLGLSYGISAVINYLVSSSGQAEYISFIPLWLSAAALGFAVLVGVLAGLMPAIRAMRLSALEAIKTQ